MRRLPNIIILFVFLGLFISLYLVQAASFNTLWGNVGIGKVPVSNLDIIGGNNATGVINATSLCIAADCKTSWAQVSAGGVPTGISGQTLRSNGTGWATSSLLFNTGTYIGINTTTPQALLHVYAPIATSSVTVDPVNQTKNNSSTGYTGSVQTWTVPYTGTYTIDAYGAQGGQGTSYTQYAAGKGARMKGDFNLIGGEVIKILVGQLGPSGSNDGGGGGGTFVLRSDNSILVIAGGGGGASYSGPGVDAVTTTSGTAGANGGTGGTAGSGGVSVGCAGAGAGYSGNGGNGPSCSNCGGGYAFLNGGEGGRCLSYTATGGFGGGGGTYGGGWGGGGGGGYSGGGASTSSQYGGGGGGSYNNGANQSNTAGYNTGHGKVIITAPGGNIVLSTQSKVANFSGNLLVSGSVKLGEPGVLCNAQTEGSIKYSTTTKAFMACNGTAWSSLLSGNTTPDSFSFITQTGLAPLTLVYSNIIQVTGIISVSVSASGSGSPQIRVCSDASCNNVAVDWTSAASLLSGKYLQVRQTSASGSLASNVASVSVGSTVAPWTVTTAMTTPNAFSFTVPGLQALNTVASSNIVQITGLTVDSAAVLGGGGVPQLRTCNDSTCSTVIRDWATTSATIANNKYLQLRATSPSVSNSTTTATVTLGTSTVPFYVPSGSDLVNAFSFSNSTSVYPNALIASTPVQITGNTIPATITITGGGSPYFKICTDAACNTLATQQTYNNTTTGYTGTIQSWTVPTTGTYTIEAWGAEGGKASSYSYNGGKGARMKGDFNLTAGEVIKILVGQKGGNYTEEAMGGGGTFVAKQTGNVALIVAGGGGGSAGNNASYSTGMDASITTSGTADRGGNCAGGASGNGGSACSNGGAGAGFNTNGAAGSSGQASYAYVNGGNGANTGINYTGYGAGASGGFGGGGGTHGGAGWGGGGGGGYSGGSAHSAPYGGGGGGSYNAGTNQSNSAGVQVGHGKVVISSPSNAISAGQYIQVLLRASQSNNTPTTATVNIGSTPISASYTATTGSATVSAFSFTDVTGQPKNATVLSNIIPITTTGTVGVSVSGSYSPAVRVCSTSNCSSVVTDWTNIANVSNGQYIQVSLVTPNTSLTAVSTDVTVGAVTDNWSVTTWNQLDPTNLSLSHSVRSKSFTVSWTAGLNNGGAGGCKLQFMDQNVSGTWKDITGTTLNCDANASNITINLQENITTSWTGTHQIRLFILNTNLAGPTFPQTLSCTTTGASYGTATPSIDENCNGQFDDATLWYSDHMYCANNGQDCYQTYFFNDEVCGTVQSTWFTSCMSPGDYWTNCQPWYAGHSYGAGTSLGSYSETCAWDDYYYYYY